MNVIKHKNWHQINVRDATGNDQTIVKYRQIQMIQFLVNKNF